jgi:hypothetical protein
MKWSGFYGLFEAVSFNEALLLFSANPSMIVDQ